MADLKKRFSIRLGFVFGTQDIDQVTDSVVNDRIVNVWGADYQRLEQEEAVLFEAELQRTCGEDLMALMGKAMQVAADFGLETIIGVPADTDPKTAMKDKVKDTVDLPMSSR